MRQLRDVFKRLSSFSLCKLGGEVLGDPSSPHPPSPCPAAHENHVCLTLTSRNAGSSAGCVSSDQKVVGSTPVPECVDGTLMQTYFVDGSIRGMHRSPPPSPTCKLTSFWPRLFWTCKSCRKVWLEETLASCCYTASMFAGCKHASWICVFFQQLSAALHNGTPPSSAGLAHHYKAIFWIGWLPPRPASPRQPLLPETFFFFRCSERLFIPSGNKLSTGRCHFKPRRHTSPLDWKTALQTRSSPKARCHGNSARLALIGPISSGWF